MTFKKNPYIRPNKIKVLVHRQHSPLKISANGTFLLPYRKKIVAKFKFSSVPVTRTSFDKRLND